MSALPDVPRGTTAVITVQLIEPRTGAMVVTRMSSGTITKPDGANGEAVAAQVGQLAVEVTRDALLGSPATGLYRPSLSR